MFNLFHPRHAAKVAGFGLSVIDVLMGTESIVLEEKNPVHRQAIQIGGVIPTALTTLTRLGIATQLHTIIGKDTLGDEICTILEKEQVSLQYVQKRPDIATPFSCVIVNKHNGARTIFYTTGSFSELTDTKIAESLTPALYLLIDGHNDTISHAFIKQAKSHGTRVLLDMGNPKPGIEALARKSYGVIIPHVYWRTISENHPEEVIKEFLTKGPQLVIATMEEKGCMVGTKEKIFHQPSYKVTAADTNGTGDVFFGAFTYGLVRGWALPKIAQFACGAAARSAAIFGKEEKIPHSEEEVNEFIRTHEVT